MVYKVARPARGSRKKPDIVEEYATALEALQAVEGLLAADWPVSYVLDGHGMEIAIDGLRSIALEEQRR